MSSWLSIVAVAAPKRRLLGDECHQIVLRLDLRVGMVGRAPDVAAADVAQIDELAPGIERGVVARPRDRQVVADEAPAAGVGDHGRVAAVRQELRVGEHGVRRREAAHRQRPVGAVAWTSSMGAQRARPATSRGHSFLQQQLGRLHAWVEVKALDHAVRRASALARATTVIPWWWAM